MGLPFPIYPNSVGETIPVMEIAADASNIHTGDNETPYTVDDFNAIYPQFESVVPSIVIDMYLGLAHSTVKESRFGTTAWKICMGLFIAHFLTLYLQSMTAGGAAAAQVLAAGSARGLVAGKSVGGVSVSIDYSLATQDLSYWAMFKTTTFGQQYATLAKSVTKGGVMVW